MTNEPTANPSSRTSPPKCQQAGTWQDLYQAAKETEQTLREESGGKRSWSERAKRQRLWVPRWRRSGAPHDPPRYKRLSWFNPKTWLNARNDVLAKISDPVDAERVRWLAGLSDTDLVVSVPKSQFSFLLIGDTGEGDFSQYAVIPPLLVAAPGTSFLDSSAATSSIHSATSTTISSSSTRHMATTPNRSTRSRAAMTGTTTSRPSCSTSATADLTTEHLWTPPSTTPTSP